MNRPALDPTRSAAVAASAGTGKTWLLAARIVRLLLAGAGFGGILALTFTRKAAAEMQARVTQRLRELALADDARAAALLQEMDLTPTPELLQRARGLYEQLLFTPWPLRATTLHAFCQDLVSRFALQTGTAPGFDIAEDETPLRDAAWQRLQRGLQRQPDSAPAQALNTLIAGGRGESALRELVLRFLELRNDWRAYAGENDGLALLRERLQHSLGVEEHEDLAAAVTHPSLQQPLDALAEHLRAAGGKINRLDLAAVEAARAASLETRLAALKPVFFTDKQTPRAFKVSKENTKRLGAAAAADCAQAYESVIAALEALLERQRRQHTLQQTLAGATLGAAALQAFERELRERSVLSFPELEWRAYRLLCQSEAASWVQYRLDARIEHLLVDEFQDTSDTQWQLLLPLLQEMAAGGDARARTAFIVGDGKQSIYGFRRANPQLLEVARDHVVTVLGGTEETLSASWRSAPAIMEFVNAVFGSARVAEHLPEFPAHDTHRRKLWGQVEVAPLIPAQAAEDEPPPFRDPLTTPRPDPENRRAYDEGRLIAARIRRLVDERYPVAQDGGARPLRHGDVMILLRKRSHQAALERALGEAGIPFLGSARGTLLQTPEVRDLLALLRFLASPVRDLDLAQALRSPLFAFSDAQLSALAQAARAHDGAWWPALCADAAPESRQAVALLGEWLQQARHLPAHDLIDRILHQGEAAARYAAALPRAQGARARANLDACAQLALSADSGRYPSLPRFLQQLQRAAPPDEAAPPDDAGAGEAVRILTVHAAKGLEAPVVFLAQATLAPQARGAGWLVDWPPGEERPREFLLTSRSDERDRHSAALLTAQAARDAREDLNLLYVACTRARQLLHVSGYETKRGSDWHALCAAALEQLSPGAVAHRSGEPPAVTVPVETPAPRPAADPRLRAPIPGLRTAAAAPEEAVEPPDPAARRRGIAVHWLLQVLSEGRSNTGLHEALEAQLGSSVSRADYSAWHREARGVLDAEALRHLYDPQRLRRAWNEMPLHYDNVNGVMDRLVDDGQTLWLFDYKTQRGGSDDALRALHREQLQRYTDGVRRLWPGRELRVGLVLTAEARWLSLD